MHKEMMEQAQGDRAAQPWSAEQANAWRARTHAMSPWLPVAMQGLVALLLLACSMVPDWSKSTRLSLVWGVLSGLLPSLLCVAGYRITTWMLRGLPYGTQAVLGLASIFCWELVKLLLSVALLILAGRMVLNLHWLTMLLAFVVVVKAYWLAFLWDRLRKPKAAQTVFKTGI